MSAEHEGEQAIAKQHQAGNGHCEEAFRSEFITHGHTYRTTPHKKTCRTFRTNGAAAWRSSHPIRFNSFSKKSRADVKAEGRHTERCEQTDAAEQRYDFERTSIGLRLFGLTH
jgi:hypothetical protein